MENLRPNFLVDFTRLDHNLTVEYYIHARLERLLDLLPYKSFINLKFRSIGIGRITGKMEIITQEQKFTAKVVSDDVVDCFDDLEREIFDQVGTWKRNRIFSYAV